MQKSDWTTKLVKASEKFRETSAWRNLTKNSLPADLKQLIFRGAWHNFHITVQGLGLGPAYDCCLSSPYCLKFKGGGKGLLLTGRMAVDRHSPSRAAASNLALRQTKPY